MPQRRARAASFVVLSSAVKLGRWLLGAVIGRRRWVWAGSDFGSFAECRPFRIWETLYIFGLWTLDSAIHLSVRG